MTLDRYYAGIGSRETPPDILRLMNNISRQLNHIGFTLRSGHADGADKAFESGSTRSQIYIPWINFNGSDSRYQPHHIVPNWNEEMVYIAKQFHPAWQRCSVGAQKLHTRNVCQVLGEDLKTPVEFVVCWTHNGLGQGGTGQAIRIAHHHNIPVYDLGSKDGDPQLAIRLAQLKEQFAKDYQASA